MNSTEQPACLACRFWVRGDPPRGGWGTCHRNAPQPVPGADRYCHAPLTGQNYWCGEFDLKARRMTADLKIAALRCYAETFCEGWCRDSGGTSGDCSGCLARFVLEAEAIQPDNRLEAEHPHTCRCEICRAWGA